MGRGAGKFAKEAQKKGIWSSEEDELLIHFVKTPWRRQIEKPCSKCRSKKRWEELHCRLRWLNYLRPCIKRDDFSEDEEELINKLLGNSVISSPPLSFKDEI